MSQREAINELSAYDNHPGDLGTETFERAKDLGLKDNALDSPVRDRSSP